MRTTCDLCGEPVKEVGRLMKMRYDNTTQYICSECRRRIRLRIR